MFLQAHRASALTHIGSLPPLLNHEWASVTASWWSKAHCTNGINCPLTPLTPLAMAMTPNGKMTLTSPKTCTVSGAMGIGRPFGWSYFSCRLFKVTRFPLLETSKGKGQPPTHRCTGTTAIAFWSNTMGLSFMCLLHMSRRLVSAPYRLDDGLLQCCQGFIQVQPAFHYSKPLLKR